MSLYRVTPDKLESVAETSFSAESLFERKDLQRLLRRDIAAIGDDLMVIAEEFGEWEDSNRRIDLLCLSKDAGLVVVEIKRTDDGGHMELQAIRYAAMVSSMTLDQAIGVHAKTHGGEPEVARAEVLEFLQLSDENEAELTGDVRIVLVSANFSTELTTAVLWLNKRDLDITCVRLRPYRHGSEVLIDVTQIIPLPESANYEVKLRAQEKEKRKVVSAREDVLLRFWALFIERSKPRTQMYAGRRPTDDHWLDAGIGRTGFTLSVSLKQVEAKVECYVRVQSDPAKSAAAFEALRTQRDLIEGQFGGPLEWQDLPGRQGCRICTHVPGGWKSPETEWPALQDRMIDAMIRLEGALRQPIQELSF